MSELDFSLPEIPKKESVSAETLKEARKLNAAIAPRTRIIIPIVATGVEVLAILAILGLLTLVQVNFIFRDIDFTSFLVMAALRLTMLFSAKDISARARIAYENGKTEYKTLVDNYENKIKEVKYDELREYLEKVANPLRKIEAYKKTIQPKIESIIVKLARLDMALGVLEKEQSESFSSSRAKRIKGITSKIAKLTVQKEKLERLISDEYIQANYKYLKVNYEYLTVEKFIAISREQDSAIGRVSVNQEIETKKSIAKGLPFALLFCAVMTYVGVQYGEANSIDWIMLTIDAFFIAFYFAQGWFFDGARVFDLIRDALIYKTTFIEAYKKKKLG